MNDAGIVKRFRCAEEIASVRSTPTPPPNCWRPPPTSLWSSTTRASFATSPPAAPNSPREIDGNWVGQSWARPVTVESRPKIESLLQDAAPKAIAPRWRQVNHLTDRQRRPAGRLLGRQGRQDRAASSRVGRDLRAISVLQQRLVDAQQSSSANTARLRNAETRNRLLFQLASEAVLILDAATLRVVEANPAATQLLGLNAPQDRRPASFPTASTTTRTETVATMLANVRASGRAGEVRARLADGSRELLVSASVFREEQLDAAAGAR